MDKDACAQPFFASNFQSALTNYAKLINHSNLSSEDAEEIQYHAVLAHDGILREKSEAIQEGESKGEIQSLLQLLEDSIESYITQHPSAEGVIQTLEIGANANRDMGYYDQATRFWSRILLLKVTTAQRKTAIRGILLSAVQSDSAGQIIVKTRNFLRLENWSDLGKSFKNEVLGILSRASINEFNRLSESGHVEEAGRLIAKLAMEFENIPNRAKLMRDGAYSIALAENWHLTEQTCRNFLNAKIAEFRGDMLYLLARSLEYQFDFAESAKIYLQLGEEHKEHKHSNSALKRSIEISEESGENTLTVAKAYFLLAKRSSVYEDSVLALKRSMDAFLKAGDFDEALAAAGVLYSSGQSQAAKLESKLFQAKVYMASKKFKLAANALDYVSRKSMQLFRTESVKKDIWSRLYAESNLISAKHVQKQFYNIDLAKHKKHHQNLQLANRKKSAAFNKLRIFFQRVIKTNIGTLSSEARFRLAETCTDYANALSVAFMNEKQSYTLKKYNRNRQQVKNLKEMAKLLHSKNATNL